VIRVLQAVYEFNESRGREHWKWAVGRRNLGLPEDGLDQAISYANDKRLVRANGTPAWSMVITPERVELLRKRGLA
jgi:hypothetical protein